MMLLESKYFSTIFLFKIKKNENKNKKVIFVYWKHFQEMKVFRVKKFHYTEIFFCTQWNIFQIKKIKIDCQK